MSLSVGRSTDSIQQLLHLSADSDSEGLVGNSIRSTDAQSLLRALGPYHLGRYEHQECHILVSETNRCGQAADQQEARPLRPQEIDEETFEMVYANGLEGVAEDDDTTTDKRNRNKNVVIRPITRLLHSRGGLS